MARLLTAGGAAAHRNPDRDETLSSPRCVFQVLKRHFARYTPEMVEQACGVPPDAFARVCELVTENSGPERTTAFVYSVGWTQHTVGVQYIRTAAILQLLLGNIGRPGGGILALRGHASIQGSTDIPTLFDLLPGYLPMPHVHGNEDLATYVQAESTDKGFWANMGSYTVSLLKSWWGDAATQANDFCFDYLPRLTGSHSLYEIAAAQLAGTCKGYILMGENSAVGSANGRMQRLALANLDWLVVRDLAMIESATWWKDGPEIATGELSTEAIGTEVFFLPAAAHTEKAGSFTNTNRLLQWHDEAVEPDGDARSDLWFMYHLGRRIRAKLADSGDPRDRPVLDLTWDYPVHGSYDEPDADAVLREINGYGPDGRLLPAYTKDVLHAGPEARRALIEEAAGVLKHRKRKEKALRKLEAMQANLTRLVDLTAELGRRLKPLGRQAEVARRAAVIQAELRDARLRLLADDYVTLAAELQRDEADEAAAVARRTALEQELGQARRTETDLDQAAQQASATLARAQETWFALSSLAERLRSTQNLAAQRHSLLTEVTEPERPGRDPDELDRQADELREETETLTARLEAGREVLAAAVAHRLHLVDRP